MSLVPWCSYLIFVVFFNLSQVSVFSANSRYKQHLTYNRCFREAHWVRLVELQAQSWVRSWRSLASPHNLFLQPSDCSLTVSPVCVCVGFSCRSLASRASILLSSIWVSTIKMTSWLFMSQHHCQALWRTTPRPLKTEMCRAPRRRSRPRTSVTEEGSYWAFCIVLDRRACFCFQFVNFQYQKGWRWVLPESAAQETDDGLPSVNEPEGSLSTLMDYQRRLMLSFPKVFRIRNHCLSWFGGPPGTWWGLDQLVCVYSGVSRLGPLRRISEIVYEKRMALDTSSASIGFALACYASGWLWRHCSLCRWPSSHPSLLGFSPAASVAPLLACLHGLFTPPPCPAPHIQFISIPPIKVEHTENCSLTHCLEVPVTLWSWDRLWPC